MRKTLLFLVLVVCAHFVMASPGVNDIDIHQAFYKNESSRNIYIQEKQRATRITL